MMTYYRIPNPVRSSELFPTISPIAELEFRSSVVGERLPDHALDLAKRLEVEPEAVARRAMAMESRQFPPGAVVMWRLCKKTGLAEGWEIERPLTA
jgi:hypothetical protein